MRIYSSGIPQVLKPLSSGNSLGWPEALRMFEIRCRGLNVTDRTWGTYLFHLTRFITWVNLSPQRIQSDTPSQYIEHQAKAGWSAHTLHGAARAIKTFLQHLHSEGITPKVTVSMPILPKRFPVAFTEDSIRTLLSHIDGKTDFGARDTALFLFYADTGARLEEAVGLKLGELDLRLNQALLHGKGRKDRMVGFGSSVSRALNAWLIRRPQVPCEWVFLNRYGGKLSGVQAQHRLKKFTKAAGIARKRLSIHAFRHYYALTALRNGADPKSVQRQLGHDDLTMTMHYVNLMSNESSSVCQQASPVDRAGLYGVGRAVLKR